MKKLWIIFGREFICGDRGIKLALIVSFRFSKVQNYHILGVKFVLSEKPFLFAVGKKI